jgi:hypothetical protein
MNSGYELHECESLPEGVEIIFSMDHDERENMVWRMFIRREAESEDIEDNHYLEEEGDTIWETSIEIVFCPFCGEQLFDLKASPFKSFGKFEHSDHSDWHVKRS